MFKFLAIAVILTVSIVSAKADGNSLLRECTSNEGAERMYCLGYVSGVAGVASDVCLPKGVKHGQAVDIVVKFLWNNPEYRHYSEDLLTHAAIAAAFPCTKKASN